MTRTASACLLISLLLACSAGQPNGNDPVSPNGAATTDAAPAEPARNAASAPGEAARPLVTLDADGVRLVDPQSGASRPLAFGTAQPQAIEVLTAAFGTSPVEQGVNAECGAGPILHARWPNGFVGLFQEGRFLGWDARAPGLTTADGIGLGSTRTQIEASREIEVEETSLGTEFRAGDLGGLFESSATDAPLVALWAGLTCLFR